MAKRVHAESKVRRDALLREILVVDAMLPINAGPLG